MGRRSSSLSPPARVFPCPNSLETSPKDTCKPKKSHGPVIGQEISRICPPSLSKNESKNERTGKPLRRSDNTPCLWFCTPHSGVTFLVACDNKKVGVALQIGFNFKVQHDLYYVLFLTRNIIGHSPTNAMAVDNLRLFPPLYLPAQQSAYCRRLSVRRHQSVT